MTTKLLFVATLFGAVCCSVIAQTLDERLVDCIRKGSPDGVSKALKDGANPNLSDNGKKTVLMMAVTFGQTDTVKQLLEKGAYPNLADDKGDTALILACVNNRADIVKMLLSKGADVNAANKKGVTCLSAAFFKRHPEIAKLVMNSGSSFNFSPQLLYAVMRSGDESILELLKEKSIHTTKDEEAISKALEKMRERKQKRAAAKQPTKNAIMRNMPLVLSIGGVVAALAAAGAAVLVIRRKRRARAPVGKNK